jgi:hypothetical protein
MRTFGVFLASAIFAVAVGCGSGSGKAGAGSDSSVAPGTGGTTIPSGGDIDSSTSPGTGEVDGAAGPAVDGAASGCSLPSCLAGAADCTPNGACVTQTDQATASTNVCYENGVKMIEQTTNAGLLIAFENAAGVCYIMSVDFAAVVAAATGGLVTVGILSATGTPVGTLTLDQVAKQTTVTCTGSAPVVLDPSCAGSMSFGTSIIPTNCTPGVCTP